MIKPVVQTIKNYQPGLSAEEVRQKYGLKRVLKLASNENPLPPPEGLLRALRGALPFINRYPSHTGPVVESASRYFQVPPEQVVLGNGSSELIDKIMQAYGRPGQDAILISENSFPLYARSAQGRGLLVHKAPMQKNLTVDVSALLALWHKHSNIRLIFISNPNNPTGSYITQKETEGLLSSTRGKNTLLIMDSAYEDYVRARDFPDLPAFLKKYPHLVLLKSLSKVMGLAGLRAGLMLAHPPVARALRQVLCPFNVNALSLKAMQYCFSQPGFKKYLSDSQKQVWEGLDYFYQEMKKAGLKFYPSQGNFLLFRPPKPGVFNTLLKKGLILRPMKEPGLRPYLRLSMGLSGENRQAMHLIKEVCLDRP